MTYPESEIRRVLKEQRYWSISDDEFIKAMKSCSDSDRERVRMELWKEVYSQALRNEAYLTDDCVHESELAIEHFDKQFPNR